MDGYDAALHLLDRQVVDRDGQLVAKVDDVELTLEQDGSLVATGLLVGLPALLPRFGDRLGPWLLDKYVEMGEERADRALPGVIEFELVDDIGSGVELSVLREGLVQPRRAEVPAGVERWRLGDLLGMRVRCGDLPKRSRVLDVRLSGVPHRTECPRVTGLVVGPGRPGSLFGYDRKPDLGPLAVALVVRRLHRHVRGVEVGPGVEIDRAANEVRINPGVPLLPLL